MWPYIIIVSIFFFLFFVAIAITNVGRLERGKQLKLVELTQMGVFKRTNTIRAIQRLLLAFLAAFILIAPATYITSLEANNFERLFIVFIWLFLVFYIQKGLFSDE